MSRFVVKVRSHGSLTDREVKAIVGYHLCCTMVEMGATRLVARVRCRKLVAVEVA